jgi:tRNA(fMet)-specific endonuclease VapC
VSKSLLDTDILSEILKGINPTVASNAAAYRQAFGRYSLSSITVMEVISGLQRNQSHRRIQKFLTDISAEEVLPFGQAEGKLAGELDGGLERVGRPIGRCDPMIAAIAITNGLELVTGNTAHYQRIQQLGYSLALVNRRI